jgi:hypothetical protein
MTRHKATCATLARHLTAINSGRVTRSNVIGMRNLINAAEKSADGWHIRNAPSLEQIDELEKAIAAVHVEVIGELHDSGLVLLRNKRHAKLWNDTERAIIEKADHFRLTGFDRIGPREIHAVPVYRLYGAGLQSFTFRNIPWQSGGNGPEILRKHY